MELPVIPLHKEEVAAPFRGRPSSIQSEGLPSLASNFSYQLAESGLRNDIETDASPLPDPRTFDSVHFNHYNTCNIIFQLYFSSVYLKFVTFLFVCRN